MEQPKEKCVALTGTEVTLSCRVETAPNMEVEFHWFKCQQDGSGKSPMKCSSNEMTLMGIIANHGYYVCNVTPHSMDSMDTISSDVAHVEVVNSTDITVSDTDQPPSDRYVEKDEKLVLKFKGTCKHYPMMYQWYHNGIELSGHTGPVLTIESIDERHMGPYHCEASSDYSANTVLSNTCRVHWS